MRIPGCLLCALLLGCYPSALRAQDFTLRDSAGVLVATSTAPAWEPGEEWSLSETPVVRLGRPVEGEDLWQVRDFSRTPDGLFTVLSAGHFEVRLFDGEGRLVRALGRSGQGPGEFVWPMSLAVAPPDTILVLDRDAIEWFLVDGTVLESIPARRVPNAFGPGRTAVPSHVAADGSLLPTVGGPVDPSRESGPFRPPQGVAYFSAPGEPPVLGGDYGGGMQELVDIGGGERTIVMPPFARFTSIGLGPSPDARFFAADNERYEIHVFDGDGALHRIVRREHALVTVRDEWVEAWKDAQRGSSWTAGQLPRLERAWERMTVPETLPAFVAAAFDSEGYMWVCRQGPVPADPTVYDVFDPEGRYLGAVDVPAGIQTQLPPRIGADYFMGLWTGALGVEQVRVYALDRGGG